MRRLLAVALVVLGVAGLVLGRLGETVWAPDTEHTATVRLKDPGAAVVIDPGVVYVGGHEGTLKVTASSDVHLIAAAPADVTAYLASARYTEVTSVPSWTTLKTRVVHPQGDPTIPEVASADLWTSVEQSRSPLSVPVSRLWRGDGGANPARPYRALVVVTDGTQPAASAISITWPVEASTPWVPYAYAGGAALAVLGLILFAADFAAASARRRRAADDLEDVEDDDEPGSARGGSHAASRATGDVTHDEEDRS